jgi:acyl-CoA synthetase (AMP-forming)/AMP-acid ligase II
MLWSALFIDCASTGAMPAEPDMDAPAILLTTSGTTGQPKFVTHTPATLSAVVEAYTHYDLNTQTVLNSCPMVHGTGLFTFLASVNFGATMVLVERFDPDVALDQIELHGCTWMLGLPFMDNTVGADHGHSEQDVLTKRIEQDNSRLDRLIDICPSC